MNHLMADLHRDTRNVLLTLARIWSTVNGCNPFKPDAATWAINKLPEKCLVIEPVSAICTEEENEYWDDLKDLIEPCADFIVSRINEQIPLIESSDNISKSIRLG